jgi:putative ABC transport system permease protein
MIHSYFTVAWRNILRNKAHSIINVFGLSLGLACTMLIILYTSDDLSFDQFHSNASNIYRITSKGKAPDGSVTFHGGHTSLFEGPRYAGTIPEIQQYVRIDETYFNISIKDDLISQRVLSADRNFFSFFSFELLRGDPETVLNDPYNIVLTEDTAIKLFGRMDVLGETVQIVREGNLQAYTVTGLAKNTPGNSSIQFGMIKLFTDTADPVNAPLELINATVNTFISVHPDTDLANLAQSLWRENSLMIADAVKVAESMGYKIAYEPALQSLSAMHLDEVVKADGSGLGHAGNSDVSQVLVIIASLILVIACINFVNLTIARSSRRAKEIGIRKVIGGVRSQLVRQFLGESFILCSVAFVSAIVIAHLLLPLFNEMVNKQLSIAYLLDFKLVVASVGLLVITGLVAGFYPAVVMSSYNPIVVLAQRFKMGRSTLQKALVIFQFGLATLLTVGALTIYRQYEYLTTLDPGYDPENIVAIDKPMLTPNEVALFRNELSTHSDIQGVSVIGGSGIEAKINGDSTIQFNCDFVDNNFIPVFKLQIAQGRNFSPEFPSDTAKAIIVNEAFVNEAGWNDPIGQTVKMWPFDGTGDRTVIGVVKDWNNTPFTQAISPEALIPDAGPFKDGYFALLARITPGSEARSLPHIEKTFKKLFPLNAYEMGFQTDSNISHYQAEARWRKIVFFAAAVTVMISCIGLLGLTMATAERRLKELSIRKVLGATVSDIVVLLAGSFLVLIFVSMLIAMPLAWYLADRWLMAYPYRFEINVWMFAEVGVIVVCIALMTTAWQSVQAALHNPVESLKKD